MKPEDESRARLMAEIEKLIEETGDPGTITLTEIEQVVGGAGRRIQQQLVGRLVEEAAQELGQVRVGCPECGGKLRYKGQKERWIVTTSGEVKVERGYFYCEACGKGVFPLEQRWELNGSVYSPALAQHMAWLSGMVPSYEAAVEVFQRVAGWAIPAVSRWRQTQRHGERLVDYVKGLQEQVSLQSVVLPGPHEDHNRRKGVSLDGGMINIRGEGWKGIETGAVFDIEQRLERDPVTRELVEEPHGGHSHGSARSCGAVRAGAVGAGRPRWCTSSRAFQRHCRWRRVDLEPSR